jgi:hypothetical protein
MATDGSEKPTMNRPDVDQLELRALEEREQIHQSVGQLRSKVTQVRDILDPQRNARKYFLPASLVASGIAFICGYSFAGLFAE